MLQPTGPRKCSASIALAVSAFGLLPFGPALAQLRDACPPTILKIMTMVSLTSKRILT